MSKRLRTASIPLSRSLRIAELTNRQSRLDANLYLSKADQAGFALVDQQERNKRRSGGPELAARSLIIRFQSPELLLPLVGAEQGLQF